MNTEEKKESRFALEARLLQFESMIVEQMLAAHPGVMEGTVMTMGPAPYRRLDCRGRALAYLKRRPMKKAVRIDVSGLWRRPGRSELQVKTASGTTLLVKERDDVKKAVAFLTEVLALNLERAA